MYSLAKSSWSRWSRDARAAGALRQLVLRAVLLVSVLLIAAPSFAARGEAFRCRHSGRVMTSCCCKAKATPVGRTATQAEVKAAPCCDAVKAAGANAVTALRDVAAQVPSYGALSSTLVPIARVSGSTTLAHVDTVLDLARAGPAIFLRDCRLLS
jgi:hypothetical protein